MKHMFKTGLLLLAITLSLVSCREQEEEKTEMEQLMEEEGAEVKVKDDKVKIKTDDKKVKIKTDDDGDVKKKVKIDN
ncbi:MAG TPA: hypothetical protein VLO29_00915 [Salegentibacter sp.]|nr:hypothetical protein [Salegentibacter sp.]